VTLRVAINHLNRRAADLEKQVEARGSRNAGVLEQTALTLRMIAQALENQDFHDRHAPPPEGRGEPLP